MKTIYFIDDQSRTGESWVRRGKESGGLFRVIHFLSPFRFEEYLVENKIEEQAYIVADKNGPSFDNSKGFVPLVYTHIPNFKGTLVLVSSTFDSESSPKAEGFHHCFYKRYALEQIKELIKNEK